MTWLARSLWLLAWSFWLWLSFGLAHHLPKRPGELVCKFERKPDEEALCFLNNQTEFAMLDPPVELGVSVIRIWDVATGKVKRQFDGPITHVRFINFDRSDRFPYVVTSQQYRPGRPKDADPDGLAFLDLRTGQWSETPAPKLGLGDFHPTRPWYVCSGEGEDRMASVVDIDTKGVILQRVPKKLLFAAEELGEPFFVGEDRVAIPVVRSKNFFGASMEKSHALEIHSLLEPDRPSQVYENIDVSWGSEICGDRIVLNKYDRTSGRQFKVLDLKRGLVVFPRPGEIEGKPRRRAGPAMLSSDGRRLLDGSADPGASRLLEIDSGKTLWTADRNELAWRGDRKTDQFLTTQDWSLNLFGLKKELYTWSHRNFNDGSLVLRTWEKAPYSDGAAGLFFADDGVRRLPFRIDWLLLAVCQAILAAPLVSLWALLRLRRRRAARRQPTEAINEPVPV